MSGTVAEKTSRVMPGHLLAAAPVGEHRHRHAPRDLGHGPDEDHGPQAGVAQVERAFDLGAEDADAVDDGVGHHGRHREQDQGREAVLPQDAHEGGRLALARAGHEGHVGHRRLVAALADRGGEELVGDDEVEEGLLSLEHRLLTYKRVPHSCDTLIPDAIVRDFGRSPAAGSRRPWRQAGAGPADAGLAHQDPAVAQDRRGASRTGAAGRGLAQAGRRRGPGWRGRGWRGRGWRGRGGESGRRRHGERSVGEHAEPGAPARGPWHRAPQPPHRSRPPQVGGRRPGPRRRSTRWCAARPRRGRRTRPRTWACQRSVSDGPVHGAERVGRSAPRPAVGRRRRHQVSRRRTGPPSRSSHRRGPPVRLRPCPSRPGRGSGRGDSRRWC